MIPVHSYAAIELRVYSLPEVFKRRTVDGHLVSSTENLEGDLAQFSGTRIHKAHGRALRVTRLNNEVVSPLNRHIIIEATLNKVDKVARSNGCRVAIANNTNHGFENIGFLWVSSTSWLSNFQMILII